MAHTALRQPAVTLRMGTLLALGAVYFIWGSTYLFIYYAVQTLPPFLMVGARVLVAGAILMGWARLRGRPLPRGREWGWAALTGILMVGGGSGSVAWAARRVPSGLLSLLVAMVPLWTVALNWVGFERARPRASEAAGLALGLGGMVLLIGPQRLAGTGADPLATLAVCIGALCWAVGSLLARRVPLPRSMMMAAGAQLSFGGVAGLLVGAALGDVARLQAAPASTLSVLSLIYLSLAGSVVAFSAYSYLLRVSTPARAQSYAYVNPVVAVLMGWALEGESLPVRTLIAAAVIVAGVVLIVGGPGREGATHIETPEPPPA